MEEEIGTCQWPFHETKENAKPDEKIPTNLFDSKNCTLVNYIEENPKAADLKWSLFCAACNSYRFDSALKPFPPFFVEDEGKKQIDRLREVVKLCPPMTTLLKELKRNTVSSALLDLLHWVLIHLKQPSFEYVPKEKHQAIISQVSSVMPAAMPDFIFNVTYSNRHQQKFEMLTSNRGTKLAFHGSRLDNFYSIVNHGLQVSFSKIAAFGPGIYLSNEMNISLIYSPRGFTWTYSTFGSHISVVALCEVIDHPDVRSEKDTKNGSGSAFNVSKNQNTSGKYFIVENSDLVRIKYLLVYNNDDFESSALMQSSTLLGWIKRHKMLTFIVAYVILLLGIGSSNSTLISKIYRRLLRKFNDIIR